MRSAASLALSGGAGLAVMALALVAVGRWEVGWLLATAAPAALVLASPRPGMAWLGAAAAFGLLYVPGAVDWAWGLQPCPPEAFCEGPGRGLALLPVVFVGYPLGLLLAVVRQATRRWTHW